MGQVLARLMVEWVCWRGRKCDLVSGDMYSGGGAGAAPAGPTPPAAPQKTANDYAGYGGYTGYQQVKHLAS